MALQNTFRNLLAGCLLSISVAADAAPIVVGQVAPLSGVDATQARAYSAGLQLALSKANKAGVGGHTFSLVRKDDHGQPDETVASTKALLGESRPLVLAGYFGDRNIDELVSSGVLESEKISLVGYRVEGLRVETPFIYSVRATLRDEITKIVEHLATVGITRLGLFHQGGPSAPPLIAVVEEVMKSKNVKLTVKGAYAPGTARASSAVVDTFIKAAPQAIILVANGAAAADFVEKYRMDGGAAQLFAHSGADVAQMSKRLGEEYMKGMAITQVTPNPYKISVKLSKELSEMVAATPNMEMPPSYAMMEGYIAGSVIVEAVRRMGAKVSREAFLSALEGADNTDLGGYKVGFKSGVRSGSKFVELTIVTDSGRIRQ